MKKMPMDIFSCTDCQKPFYRDSSEYEAHSISPIISQHLPKNICPECREAINPKGTKEFIIICQYCKRQMGEFKDHTKKYFSETRVNDSPACITKSHGICKACYEDNAFKK